MVEAAVTAEREHVDAIRIASRRRGLAAERAPERLPLVPALAVPVPIAKLAVVVDGEELALSAITPRRDGRAPLERAAQRDPIAYLMRPCFLSHSFATSFGSFLSTSTSLFIPVSSAVVSFGAMELTTFLKSSPALLR